MTLDDVAKRFAYGEDHEAFRQTVRGLLRKEGVPHAFWQAAGAIGAQASAHKAFDETVSFTVAHR